MGAMSTESVQEWLRKDQDEPIVQHMHQMCALQEKTIEDIAEACIQEFLYNGPFLNGWRTYEPSHIGSYALTFTDKTSHYQYWHFATKMPITSAETKELIDRDRLTPNDRAYLTRRAFLEADLSNLWKQTGAGNEQETQATSESSEESTYSTCREQAY